MEERRKKVSRKFFEFLGPRYNTMIGIQWNRTIPMELEKKLRMKCCVNGDTGGFFFFLFFSRIDRRRCSSASPVFQPYLRRISSFRWMGTTQRTTLAASRLEASKVDGRMLKQTSRASGMKRKDKRGRRQTILL